METLASPLATEIRDYARRSADRAGTTVAVKPAHRIRFHWPPHPVSYEYNVHPTDWAGKVQLQAHGEEFSVQTARTPFGVFGRCEELWLEAKGDDDAGMLEAMRMAAEPLFQRQFLINHTLEQTGRFRGHIRDLPKIELLKLLYCEDRDVAHEARVEIEVQASDPEWLPGLIQILDDRIHPTRRSAQWCVLDLFEGLPTFVSDEDGERLAVESMQRLIWDAEDDYARTIYKAGVVLGGHIPHRYGGPALLACLDAPSKFGRRSAIHGLFHVVEWMPEMMETVVQRIRGAAERESDPQLKAFAEGMANDIEAGELEHVMEPVFPEES